MGCLLFCLLTPKHHTTTTTTIVRYCNGHQGPFGWDATGASNEAELRMLLETLGACAYVDVYMWSDPQTPHIHTHTPTITVMIRRMKKEALADGGGLPPKIREYVKVAVDPSWGVEIDAALKEKEVSMG